MKKTVKEMIEVMQAYADGKKIEFGSDNPISSTKWKEAVNPIWDWDSYDYRIKPEPHYVPYDSVDEADRSKLVRLKTEDISQRENKVKPFSWVNMIEWWTLKEMFDELEYEDGTPFGKIAKERGE